MSQNLEKLEEKIAGSSVWENIKNFLDLHINFTEKISVSILDLIIVVTTIFITTIILRILFRILTRNLPREEKSKFKVVYGYFRWLIYVVILLITLHSVGVNVTAVFAASAALLIGIGLALQTLFQDIISGVFILIDQTVHVGDIIEIDGKVGRVEEIKLRTTRAVTIDNKVLVIPNHLYLENSLYNWTQNGNTTREAVTVGVAYGSDIDLVIKILEKNCLFKRPAPTQKSLASPNPLLFLLILVTVPLTSKLFLPLTIALKHNFLKVIFVLKSINFLGKTISLFHSHKEMYIYITSRNNAN